LAVYVVRIETEPCEIPGVTLAIEGGEDGYVAQSQIEGGEQGALMAAFDALSLMMREAGSEQVARDLARWREDA
jgi:hypothetical protein